MTRKEMIEQRLQEAFSPSELSIIDESHKHAGHAGHDGKGESHFRVKIIAQAFDGVLLVKRHRMVYEALGELMQEIHALAIDAKA